MKWHIRRAAGVVLGAIVLGLAGCPTPGTDSTPPTDTKTPATPLSISGLSARIAGDKTVALTWTETGTAGNVTVRWTPGGSTAQIVAAGQGTYNATGLADATSYSFTVTSVDAGGKTTATLAASATTTPSGATFISTAAGLGSISTLSGYYVLTADIDMTGVTFTPIGSFSSQFTGTFDGNGHVIRNLTYSGANESGLFGVNSGTVKNLGVVNASITGAYDVGAVAGINYKRLENCYATGTVNGSGNYVGGIAGLSAGSVLRCASACTVNGGDHSGYVGGLVGTATSVTMADCYATGNVRGRYSVGGLIGTADGTVTNCYAAGIATSVISIDFGGFMGSNSGSTVTSCYFNSANTGNSIGTAKSLSDLRIQSTFSGWDFASTWGIDSSVNNGYPHLLSQ